MRRWRRRAAVATLLAGAGLAACDRVPGRPTEADRYLRPTQVTSFDALYASRCAGCHGADGRLGAARPLADPLYLAWASDETLRRVVAEGVAGSMMPAFAIRSGGELTDEQVRIVVDGMRQRWATPGAFAGAALPPYVFGGPGSPAAGAAVFRSACARCHGNDGAGGAGASAGSVVDPAYLALVSDQALRSAVVAGRIDLGQPDYRSVDPAGALSPKQIDDLVAWLRSKRSNP